MKFSILAVALFASTTLVSVTSAAVNGGVRGSGSIDQTQTRRSLEPDCAGCGDDKSFYVDGATGGCLVKQRTDRDKCKTIEISWRKDALTKYECGIFQSIGWADGWCPFPQDPQPPAQDPPIVDDFWNDSRASCNACGGFWPTTQPANCHDRNNQDLTECGTGIRKLDGNFGIPPGDNVVSCNYEQPRNGYFEDDIPVEDTDAARACYNPDKRCSREVENNFPQWCSSDYMGRFGGYRGSCSGTNNCLNLDFHCADGEYCELSCTGRNSCKGVTMHCADNQFCEMQLCGNGRCVGAKVICGEGTVAQGLKCVPADRPNDCGKPILGKSILDEVCSDCAGCWMSNAFWLTDKCQTKNFFNKEVDLTEVDCSNMKSAGLADGWCA